MPTEEQVRRVECFMCLGGGRGSWYLPEWARQDAPECQDCNGKGWVYA